MKQEIVDKNFIDNFRSHLQKKKPKNCLIITSQGNLERGRLEEFKSILYLHNIQVEIFLVNDYPDFKIISEALNSKQKKCYEFVISIGGGSAIDVGKIYSSCISNKRNIENIEDIELEKSKLIFNIAIPTTAGTGAESTQFSTIWSKELVSKYSYEDKSLLPEVVYLIPEFLLSLPKLTTLSTSLDTICHSLDSILNKYKNNKSSLLSTDSLMIMNNYVPKILEDPSNIEYRKNSLKASNLAGKAINITRTSLNHSISYPLTNLYGLEHGFACAFSVLGIIENFRELIESIEEASFIFQTENLIRSLNLNQNYKSKLNNIDIYLLIEQIVGNARLSNFCFPIEETDLFNILEYSYKNYLLK